jgi:hypothetical protein
MRGFTVMTPAAEIVIQVSDRREEAGEIPGGSFCLRAAGTEIARAKKVGNRDEGNAHGAVLMCAFSAGNAIFYP